MKDHSDLGGMFDMTGIVRGEDGIKRYEGLPRNLVQMFRAADDAGHVEHAAQLAVVRHEVPPLAGVK